MEAQRALPRGVKKSPRKKLGRSVALLCTPSRPPTVNCGLVSSDRPFSNRNQEIQKHQENYSLEGGEQRMRSGDEPPEKVQADQRPGDIYKSIHAHPPMKRNCMIRIDLSVQDAFFPKSESSSSVAMPFSTSTSRIRPVCVRTTTSSSSWRRELWRN